VLLLSFLIGKERKMWIFKVVEYQYFEIQNQYLKTQNQYLKTQNLKLQTKNQYFDN